MLSSEHIPLLLTLAYGLAVSIIVVVYWRNCGPANFLWLSDVALGCDATLDVRADCIATAGGGLPYTSEEA